MLLHLLKSSEISRSWKSAHELLSESAKDESSATTSFVIVNLRFDVRIINLRLEFIHKAIMLIAHGHANQDSGCRPILGLPLVEAIGQLRPATEIEIPHRRIQAV
jgi:hypothetical protein